jgi:uncharacterized protein with PIN domain
MPLYCIDTSSLVAAWIEHYPIDNFEGFWERLDALFTGDAAVISKEVVRESEKRDKELYKWLKARAKGTIEIDDACQTHVTYIMGKYPKFVDTRAGKNLGDPFVIGLARTYDPFLTVVSEESGGNANRPKIPSVCAAEGVNCIKLVDLIRREKWRFKI